MKMDTFYNNGLSLRSELTTRVSNLILKRDYSRTVQRGSLSSRNLAKLECRR